VIIKYENYFSVQTQFFDAAKCTKVMIHGFGSSGNTSWIIDMKDGNV
jgi:hypothetical protein